MAHPILVFGHSVLLEHPVFDGLDVRDVTRAFHPAVNDSRIAPLLEGFLDPFVRSFLFALEAGAYDWAHVIVIWRAGANALHAYRYACELRRLGILPFGPPLHLWNSAEGATPAAKAFEAHEVARMKKAFVSLPRSAGIDRCTPLAQMHALQQAGRLTGAEAFSRRLEARYHGRAVITSGGLPVQGKRIALAGAPLGNDALHRMLDACGALVLDLQGPDEPRAATRDLLTAYGIETLVWQVDPHDDLYGWRMPGLRRLCASLSIQFVDLGFVPTWPNTAELEPFVERLQ